MIWLWILVRWAVMAAAVALSAWVLPDVELTGGVATAFWIAVLVGLVNMVVTVVVSLTPLRDNPFAFAITVLLVNGLAVWGVSSLTTHFAVDGFLAGVGVVLMISIFSLVIEAGLARLLPSSRVSVEDVRM